MKKTNNHVWNPGSANPKQKSFFASRALYTCYGGAKGGGKALRNGTLICTPAGWQAIERLKVGDRVIGADGKPVMVLGVYPQGFKKIYDITFRDGFTITASGDHLWKYRVTGKSHTVNGVRKTRCNWEVGTTLEMLEAMSRKRSDQSIVIPLCGAVEWVKKDLPLKPYTVGALIGDGGLTDKHVSICNPDDEVISRIRADGYEISKWKADYTYGVLGISSLIAHLGMNTKSCDKRIPQEYLHSDVSDRLELLRGLMDTDGFCDTRGHCSYCSVSEGLAEDVQYLVRSLGGMATLSRKERKSGLSFEVTIRMPNDKNEIFHLTRKKERLTPYNGGISDVTRRIVSITESGEQECTCIKVDSPDSLFVAEGFVVTHNTWAVRTKALGGAYMHDGIRILIMRRTYAELQSNHVEPMLKMIDPELVSYNGKLNAMNFVNGSLIRFGHWSGDISELEYNGQEYDWIFIDEATQFTWRSFQFLGGLLRGTLDVPKRMYLTCNPGGIGHRWVKRLFIDRDFKTDSKNHEENENPDDYVFIPATIDDNKALLKSSPNYLKQLSQLPENIRNAYRYGIWDDLGGNYFPEFGNDHIVKPFAIPLHWPRYRSIDYGLDMLHVLWHAVDENGRIYTYREANEPGLVVKDAAKKMHDMTLPHERIIATFAPPDIWNKQKDTGRTMADIFFEEGVPLIRADNNRVQGHMLIKDALTPMKDGKPGLMIFNGCAELIDCLKDIQADEKNPSDCAKEPHDITHAVDALRYFCISRVTSAEAAKVEEEDEEDFDTVPYDEFMKGNSLNYLRTGGVYA